MLDCLLGEAPVRWIVVRAEVGTVVKSIALVRERKVALIAMLGVANITYEATENLIRGHLDLAKLSHQTLSLILVSNFQNDHKKKIQK